MLPRIIALGPKCNHTCPAKREAEEVLTQREDTQRRREDRVSMGAEASDTDASRGKLAAPDAGKSRRQAPLGPPERGWPC